MEGKEIIRYKRMNQVNKALGIDCNLIDVSSGISGDRLCARFNVPVEVPLPNGDRGKIDYVLFNVVWNIIEVRVTEPVALQMEDGVLLTALAGEIVRFNRDSKIDFLPLEWPEDSF
ncbi:hypothetical protein NO1_1052 [Candidatus Termititenax aidoneus]|uniref:Uncharacterized protein n=1 Tax=Termititenax aidoneus TaxID=2218524 RepID=A0A388TBG7_TERA1|nr:hypothetical protein NO1_1052 [Candidatus Termititenax aidoneus]